MLKANQILSLFLLSILLGCNTSTPPEPLSPADFDQNEKERKAYFNFTHKAAPDVNWKEVNAENFRIQHKRLASKKFQKGADVQLFNGNLIGKWKERGANNQSGDVQEIALDKNTDSLYVISTSGQLWKGHINGNGWRPLNEQKVVSTRALLLLDVNGNNRLITGGIGNDNKQLFYSDDDGKTFTKATGLSFYDTYGSIQNIVQLNNDEQTILVLVHTWISSPWGAGFELYISRNQGVSYQKLESYTNAFTNQIALTHIVKDDKAFLLDAQKETLFSITENGIEELGTGSNLPLRGGTLTASYAGTNGDTPKIYFYNNDNNIYQSTDAGDSWTFKGVTPTSPYRARVFADPLVEDKLLFGQVEVHTSLNAGASFTQYSSWYDFYSVSQDFPHADIMKFHALEQKNGELAYFILNHSGIHYAENATDPLTFINHEGLNISTYYDQMSEDEQGGYLFAGAQDKGYHGIQDDGTSIQNHTFLATGDYVQMHITEENGQKTFWREYPFGSYYFHFNPINPWDGGSFETPGDDKQLWAVPSSPSPFENAIWVGGGRLNGGSGSYLRKAFVDGSGLIDFEEINYNFYNNSNTQSAVISATNQSAADENRLYVSTSDGTFFYSNDLGNTWSKSNSFNGPEGEFLYGTFIQSSRIDADMVYISGSGYSNPGVYKSENGGVSFEALANGLPNTFVYELDLDTDEKYLFAATDAGPFVCDLSTGDWESMLGDAPLQSYRAVQYMPNLNKVRFATYGRGIWDFDLETSSGINDLANSSTKVYPNPISANQKLHIDAEQSGVWTLYNASNGKLVARETIQKGSNTIKLNVSKTLYVWSLQDESSNIQSGKLLVE